MEGDREATPATPQRPSTGKGRGSPARLHLSEGSRITNFLNGRDGEGRELRSPYHHAFPNTNTSTIYADRLCGSPNAAANTIVQEILRSLKTTAALRSTRPRTATTRSLVCNDTRLEVAQPPYVEGLGPGSYDIDGGSPPLGPLPPHSPSRGAVPSRDPQRQHRAFVSPPRPPPRNPPTAAEHLGAYVSPTFQPQPDVAPHWFKTTTPRTEPADYRYCGRYTEAGKKVAVSMETYGVVSNSGKPVAMSTGLPTKAVGVPFMSRQPRFVALPTQRHNDVRLSVPRSDEDPAALGPGSYGGGATASHRVGSARTRWGGVPIGHLHGHGPTQQGRSWSGRPGKSSQPTSFSQGTARSHKYGPFCATSDSSHVRY